MKLRTPALVVTAIVTTAAVSGAVGASAAVRYVALGAKNSTTAATTLTNTAGTPLSLAARSGYAPLVVNSTKTVSRLNADYVDGYHASSFAKVTGKTGVILAPADDTSGTAACPKGTVLTGGGGLASDGLDYSGPSLDVANAWETIGNGNTYTFAVCYSPTGSVPGAMTSSALAGVTAKAKPKVSPSPTPIASGTTRPSPATASPSPSP